MQEEWSWDHISKLQGTLVIVKRGNIESAIRQLKRKITQENILKDAQKHEFFVPGTQKRRKKEAEARRRWLKRQKELQAMQYGE